MRRPFHGWVILLLVAACDGSTEEGGGDSAAGSGGNAARADGGGGSAPGSTGGTAPSGGAGGGGGCVVDTDCVLYADCCTQCIAVTRDYVPAACYLPCIGTCPATARARCVQGGCVVDTVAPDPAVLGVWYYTWNGDNLSAFQIALCSDGRARYLFAESPSDPHPLLSEGSYTATTPATLTVQFDPPPRVSAQQLAYDAARDRLVRVGAADGYDTEGIHLQRAGLTWVTPVLGCD